MTIDLKWALPFVLPFATLLPTRLLFFVAGAGWNGNAAAAISLLFGAGLGFSIAFMMATENVRWDITIGDRND